MSEKSFVGMGFTVCPICGVEHDEVVLLHKHPKVFDGTKKFMGFDLCPEHEKTKVDYLAFVELKGDHSKATLNPQEVHNTRTGNFAMVRRSVVPGMINIPVPVSQAMVYVQEGVIAALQKRVDEAYETQEEDKGD